MILVPVIFAFMGFAVDLGRLYLIRGELNQAAAAMALAAAARLTGTQDALEKATAAANLPLDDSTGHGARYSFGTVLVGQGNGVLASTVETPRYFSTLAGATGDGSAEEADGASARHAQVNLTADAPLLFWALFSLGQSRATPVAARAVAGLSAPLCTACGIEPIAVQAVTQEDATNNFGFTPGTRYTFAYQCTPSPPDNQRPQPLGPGQQVISYLLIDPAALATGGTYVDTGDLEETQALYRIGAQGLIPSTAQAKSCVRVGDAVAAWGTNGGLTAGPITCNAAPPAPVQFMLCGMYTRFNLELPTVCQSVPDVDVMATAYQPDTEIGRAHV